MPKAKLFLDIRDRANSRGNEEGLSGLAFHPDYGDNGNFFVNYVASHPRRTVIARFHVQKNIPDAADPGSEQSLLEFLRLYETITAARCFWVLCVRWEDLPASEGKKALSWFKLLPDRTV